MKKFLGAAAIVLLCVGCFRIMRPVERQENKINEERRQESVGVSGKMADFHQPSAENKLVQAAPIEDKEQPLNNKNEQRLVRTQAFSKERLDQEDKLSLSTQNVQSSPLKFYSEKQEYENALNVYNNRSYKEAIKLFDAFMVKYPNGALMPNALYWKAESLYSQGEYVDAILIFKAIPAKYPKSNKAPDALLKIGMSYDELGDKENALLHYRVLFADYPNSTAVVTAKKLGLQPIE